MSCGHHLCFELDVFNLGKRMVACFITVIVVNLLQCNDYNSKDANRCLCVGLYLAVGH